MNAKGNRSRPIGLLPILLLFGCSTGSAGTGMTNRNQTMGDPLVGGGTPVRSMPTNTNTNPDRTGLAYGTGTGNPSRPVGPLPSLPTPSGSISPAALTSGTTGQLDAAPALRIGGNPEPRGDPSWRGPGETPRAILQPPTPTPGGDVTPTITIPPLTQVAHRVGGASLEQLKQQLTALGVVQRNVTEDKGEVILTCRVANKQNPNLMQVYEATASTEVEAMQAVIEQILQERR